MSREANRILTEVHRVRGWPKEVYGMPPIVSIAYLEQIYFMRPLLSGPWDDRRQAILDSTWDLVHCLGGEGIWLLMAGVLSDQITLNRLADRLRCRYFRGGVEVWKRRFVECAYFLTIGSSNRFSNIFVRCQQTGRWEEYDFYLLEAYQRLMGKNCPVRIKMYNRNLLEADFLKTVNSETDLPRPRPTEDSYSSFQLAGSIEAPRMRQEGCDLRNQIPGAQKIDEHFFLPNWLSLPPPSEVLPRNQAG